MSKGYLQVLVRFPQLFSKTGNRGKKQAAAGQEKDGDNERRTEDPVAAEKIERVEYACYKQPAAAHQYYSEKY